MQILDLRLTPQEIHDKDLIARLVCSRLGIPREDLSHWEADKRSIDARKRVPEFQLRIRAYVREPYIPEAPVLEGYVPVGKAPAAVIIGAGPAGYFAALELIRLGIRPLVFDRGKDVQTRRRDLRNIQQHSVVDPNSNYCFGEGGAGTYSDGKLYTRSTKRGPVHTVFRLLVEHGADPDILVDAHPHIGSNKLPAIVANLRESIKRLGGEVHFQTRLTSLKVREGQLESCILDDAQEIPCQALVLATGHSARDVFHLLRDSGIRLEFKPFALGVRSEHPQSVVDLAQYHQSPRHPNLPAASFSLVSQVQGRGVFSFCMCPGGLIVPAATAPGELVTNGMSLSRRDSPFANSGMVVSLDWKDLPAAYHSAGVLAGLVFQQEVEQGLFQRGDGSQRGPAQRLTDFLQGRLSRDLPGCSYIPGLYSAPLHEWLPPNIAKPLRGGLLSFGQKLRGFLTEEAVLVAPESRTSSPVRIPRDPGTLMHPEVRGLFPCGEGAGYAGGIVSAALDGMKIAQSLAAYLGVER